MRSSRFSQLTSRVRLKFSQKKSLKLPPRGIAQARPRKMENLVHQNQPQAGGFPE